MPAPEDFWVILASGSQALAAVGTFATVYLASRQWRRQWRPRLSVSIDTLRTIPHAGSQENYVQVEALNSGLRSVIVMAVQYRPFRWSKRRWFSPPNFHLPLTTRLPATIEMGVAARLLWTPEEWRIAIAKVLQAEIAKHPLYRHPWQRFLICEVTTSTGERFSTKLSAPLLKVAAEALAEQEERKHRLAAG